MGRSTNPLDSLSERELEVLTLAAERSLSYAEIAAKLRPSVKPGTVHSFMSRICRKLGVRNRREAVAVYYRERG